jgi:D-beta-D-heptose 7-phosphate kinase/D-beta-D-heptose 1-phosphate adenosyltransferase
MPLNLPVDSLLEYVRKFPQAKVLVIGDLIMDEFLWGKVERISPEAPVPVVNVSSESLRLGGAGNVLNNVHDLGGKALICGVIGNDDMGRKLIHQLRQMGINPEGVIVERERVTTVKTRVIAHHQQVVRFDRESRTTSDSSSLERMISYVRSHVKELDAVIISDYQKGMVSRELLEEILPLIRENGKIICVDPKPKNFSLYQGVTVITPNQNEASLATGMEIEGEEDLVEVGKAILERLNCHGALITRGEEGMTLFEQGGGVTHIPTVAREVYDVTGAGDTVIGAFSLALAVGASFLEAAVISNYAAGIVISKIGTATANREELENAIKNKVFPKS